MDLGKYIFNLETEKIELHFAKSDYMSLTDDQKKEIKSHFLWSNKGGCWVSRAKEPNLYWTRKVAESVGFSDEERKGERLSFAEKIEVQKERAEGRAERYEDRAGRANERGDGLCSAINSMHGDIAFFTQPIIPGHGGSEAFARRRKRMFAQYERGMKEYSKSEYYRGRASTALDTASMKKLEDKGYLMRKIKECQLEIKKRNANCVSYEEVLFDLENGKKPTSYDGTPKTQEQYQGYLEREIELIHKAMDKQAFMENKLSELGGVTFNRENIKVGYVVQINNRSGGEVVSTGPQNIQYRSHGLTLTAAYAEITKILKAEATVKLPHPFEVGETFDVPRYGLARGFSDPTPIHTYEIIKRTDVSVTLRNNTMPADKPLILRPSQSKFTKGAWDLTIKEKWFQKAES